MHYKMPKTKEFIKLSKSVKSQYLGEPVSGKYRKKYGKRYDKKEVKNVAYAIAKSRGIKIHIKEGKR